MNTAKKRQKLDNNIFQVQGIAQKYNCSLKQLDYQQEAALMSCIPPVSYTHLDVYKRQEYGRQKGWERENPATDSGNPSEKTMDGFVEVTEQMELPF